MRSPDRGRERRGQRHGDAADGLGIVGLRPGHRLLSPDRGDLAEHRLGGPHRIGDQVGVGRAGLGPTGSGSTRFDRGAGRRGDGGGGQRREVVQLRRAVDRVGVGQHRADARGAARSSSAGSSSAPAGGRATDVAGGRERARSRRCRRRWRADPRGRRPRPPETMAGSSGAEKGIADSCTALRSTTLREGLEHRRRRSWRALRRPARPCRRARSYPSAMRASWSSRSGFDDEVDRGPQVGVLVHTQRARRLHARAPPPVRPPPRGPGRRACRRDRRRSDRSTSVHHASWSGSLRGPHEVDQRRVQRDDRRIEHEQVDLRGIDAPNPRRPAISRIVVMSIGP